MTLAVSGLVYLVDDDPLVRRAVSRLIEASGLRVESFAGGEELLASKRTSEERTCLLLDVRMPGMSGPELGRELRARGDRTPIVFLTGHGSESQEELALEDGVVAVLGKPIHYRELIAVLERALLTPR